MPANEILTLSAIVAPEKELQSTKSDAMGDVWCQQATFDLERPGRPMKSLSVELSPHCRIRFVKGNRWTAIVSETAGMLHRVLTVPVICQNGLDVEKALQLIHQSKGLLMKHSIRFLPSKQLVFIGSAGLRGGSPTPMDRQGTTSSSASTSQAPLNVRRRPQADRRDILNDISILQRSQFTFQFPDRNIPATSLHDLKQILESSDIHSVTELVRHVNASQETSETRALLKWALEHVKVFTQSSIETFRIGEIREYLSFVNMEANGEARRQFLAQWFCSIANKLAEHRLGEAVFFEEIEKTMYLMDSRIFAGEPTLLTGLCNTLLDKLDIRRIALTQSTYRTYSPILYTLHHLLYLLGYVAPAEWNPISGLYQTYKNRLLDLRNAANFYPFQFLLSLLSESLKQLQQTGSSVRMADLRRRITVGLQGSLCVAAVIRSLLVLDFDPSRIITGWSLCRNACSSMSNSKPKRWFLGYQELHQSCLLAVDQPEHYSDVSHKLPTSWRYQFSLLKPRHRKAFVFGSIELLETLFLRSDSHEVCQNIINDLLRLRDKYYEDADVIDRIIKALASICSHNSEPQRQFAKAALTDWNMLGALHNCSTPNRIRNNKTITNARLRAALVRWLDRSTLDELFTNADPTRRPPRHNTQSFFENVKSNLKTALPTAVKSQVKKVGAVQTITPPPLVEFFQGRGDEVRMFLELFENESDAVVIGPPIVGQGGIGKTQLAIKIFNTLRSVGHYDYVFWIPSHSWEALIDSYAMIARILEISPDEKSSQDLINAVRFRLQDKFCLYVFDDASSSSDLRTFLPLDKGHVIITSRKSSPSKWYNEPKPLSLSPLKSKDALDMAVKFGFKGSEQEQSELLAALSKMPLYPLTAAHIFSTLQLEDYPPDQWIQRVLDLSSIPQENNAIRDLDATPHDRINYDLSITTIILKTIQALAAKHFENLPVAQRLLLWLSYMDTNGIPLDWILLWNSEEETEERSFIRKSLCLLEDYSLVQWDRDEHLIFIHAEVQLVVRRQSQDVDFSVVVDALIKYVGDVRWEHLNYAKWMSTMSHARTLFSWMEGMKYPSNLLQQMAHHLMRACRIASLLEESVKWARKTLDFARLCHPDQNHPDIIDALQGLAVSLQALGNQPDAYDLLQEALARERRRSAEVDDDRLTECLLALGHCTYAMGKTAKALDIFEEALDLLDKPNPPDEPALKFQLKNNIANCLSDLGREQEALKMREDVLRDAMVLYRSEENPYVASCILNLGNSLANVGSKTEALQRFEQASDLRNRLHGSRPHPDKLQSLHNLSWILSKLNRDEEAFDYAKQTLNMSYELHVNRDHANIISAKHMVAITCPSDEAIGEELRDSEANEALEMARRLFGVQDHPLLARSMTIVGILCSNNGDSRSAIDSLHRAYLMLQRLKGEEHPTTQLYGKLWRKALSTPQRRRYRLRCEDEEILTPSPASYAARYEPAMSGSRSLRYPRRSGFHGLQSMLLDMPLESKPEFPTSSHCNATHQNNHSAQSSAEESNSP